MGSLGMRRAPRAAAFALLAAGSCAACHGKDSPAAPTSTVAAAALDGTSAAGPIYVVLFTHIEDNTPAGDLGTPQNRSMYLTWRARLIAMALSARSYGLRWSLQSDWQFLLAAQMYEDAATRASTGGVNIFRYLRDSLGVWLDPHSHESGGYNYADVAYLHDALGVGGSRIIGGHVWDPSLPQFAHWERFRSPLAGRMFPQYVWPGSTLMGSGTPNHTNDPIVSGVWRPRDPFQYFEDDPLGNVSAVGAWKGDVAGVDELTTLYRTGAVPASCILTSTYGIPPASFLSDSGLASVERDVLAPFAAMNAARHIESTDFTSLVATWMNQFSGKGCVHR